MKLCDTKLTCQIQIEETVLLLRDGVRKLGTRAVRHLDPARGAIHLVESPSEPGYDGTMSRVIRPSQPMPIEPHDPRSQAAGSGLDKTFPEDHGMKTDENRRRFLRASAVAATGKLLPDFTPARGNDRDPTVRVVVWDERQPQQKQAYEDFLGNRIAEHLRTKPGFSVKSVALDDPDQGLSEGILGECDVLIWWGHVRQAEVTPETGKKIVARILAGDLALIALHSAHWSTPFVEAMNERTRRDAERTDRDSREAKVEIRYLPPTQRYTVPKRVARVTAGEKTALPHFA